MNYIQVVSVLDPSTVHLCDLHLRRDNQFLVADKETTWGTTSSPTVVIPTEDAT